LYRNGVKSHGYLIFVPDSLEELVRIASEKLQFQAAYCFTELGGLVDDVRLLRDNDMVYVAADGEGFVDVNQSPRDELALAQAGIKRKSDQIESTDDNEQVKLFVGSLDRNLGQEDVQKVFSEYGTVIEVKMLTDKATGKSKGAAFVRFSSRSAGDRAIAARNNQLLPGVYASRPITVKYADGDPAAEVGVPGEFKLFVGSLPKTVTEIELREIFSRFGSPSEVVLLRNQQSRGAGGFVKYKFKKEALAAISGGHGMVVQGSPIVVRFADNKNQQSSHQQQQQQQQSQMMGNMGMPMGMPQYQEYLAQMSQQQQAQQIPQMGGGHAPFCPAQYGYQVCSCGVLQAAAAPQQSAGTGFDALAVGGPPNKRPGAGGFQMNQAQVPQAPAMGQQMQQLPPQLQLQQQQMQYAQQLQQQMQMQQPMQQPQLQWGPDGTLMYQAFQ